MQQLNAVPIREPYIDQILEGTKVVEFRTKSTNIRGTIGLIRTGSKTVVGTCEIVDVVDNGELYEWVLANVRRLKKPVPYHHRPGAVTWVKLDEDTSAKVLAAPYLEVLPNVAEEDSEELADEEDSGDEDGEDEDDGDGSPEDRVPGEWSRPRQLAGLFRAAGMAVPERLSTPRFQALLRALREAGLEACLSDDLSREALREDALSPGVRAKVRLRVAAAGG
jgi:hypothetical protein